MKSELMRELTERSLADTVTFPEVVQALLQNGVESYTVDLIQNIKTHYLSDGKVFTEKFHFEGPVTAPEFDAEKVIASIRLTQAGKQPYREFLKSIMAAGCSVYTAYLTGRKVIYMGRKGDFHIEHFPSAK